MEKARNAGCWLVLASWVGVGGVGALACGGGGSTAGSDRGAALLASEAIEPGETCSAGGQRVRAGFDRNGDGELQEEEVTQEVALCNGEGGSTGPRGPAGEPGADGGKGDPGAKGEVGASSVLRLTEVGPGSPCCAGGVRFEVGLDADEDGELDPEEVDAAQTKHVCHGTPDGITQCRHLFLTSAAHRGDTLGGIAGADAKCNEDANRPNEGEYKALLVHGTERVACTTADCSGGVSEHVDWVLSPKTHYLRADGTTLVGTTNDVGLWQFPLANSYVDSSGPSVWTGLGSDWTTSDSTCGNWAVGDLYGQVGVSGSTTRLAISQSMSACVNPQRVVCVEQ